MLRAIRTMATWRNKEASLQRVRSSWGDPHNSHDAIVFGLRYRGSELVTKDLARHVQRLTARDLDDFYFGPQDEDEAREIFSPTKKDESDALIALSWWSNLSGGKDGDRRIVSLRAWKWGYRSIGKETGRTDGNARQRYRSAIGICWGWANERGKVSAAGDGARGRTAGIGGYRRVSV